MTSLKTKNDKWNHKTRKWVTNVPQTNFEATNPTAQPIDQVFVLQQGGCGFNFWYRNHPQRLQFHHRINNRHCDMALGSSLCASFGDLQSKNNRGALISAPAGWRCSSKIGSPQSSTHGLSSCVTYSSGFVLANFFFFFP